MVSFKSDEPASSDGLGRAGYAAALARVAATCETPMTIGVFGGWGTGKTSLMAMVRQELESDLATVWFNAWEHQHDEQPAVGLMRAMIRDLGRSGTEELKKLSKVVALALLGPAAKTLSLSDIQKLGDQAEREATSGIDRTELLRANLRRLVLKQTAARNAADDPRLVIFIDDLDRCLPEFVLQTLEAIKLYLNQPGTVCVLGVDTDALRQSIRHHYGSLDVNDAEYLDKIVQLPFQVPPIAEDRMVEYTRALLPEPLHGAAGLLGEALRRNPRSVKRFTNVFQLARQLWARPEPPDASVMAGVLLIQHKQPELYAALADAPDQLRVLLRGEAAEDDEDIAFTSASGDALELEPALRALLSPLAEQVGDQGERIQHYFHMATIATASADNVEDEGKQRAALEGPSDGFLGREELLHHPSLLRKLGRVPRPTGFFLLLGTKQQRTWLVRTDDDQLVCLLDDARTRANDSVAQWILPLSDATPIKTANPRVNRVNIGPKHGWVYSRKLHDPEQLKARLGAFVAGAGDGFKAELLDARDAPRPTRA